MKTISDLRAKIEIAEAKQDEKSKFAEIKRLKNMISAYESRLLKRATTEDLRE